MESLSLGSKLSSGQSSEWLALVGKSNGPRKSPLPALASPLLRTQVVCLGHRSERPPKSVGAQADPDPSDVTDSKGTTGSPAPVGLGVPLDTAVPAVSGAGPVIAGPRTATVGRATAATPVFGVPAPADDTGVVTGSTGSGVSPGATVTCVSGPVTATTHTAGLPVITVPANTTVSTGTLHAGDIVVTAGARGRAGATVRADGSIYDRPWNGEGDLQRNCPCASGVSPRLLWTPCGGLARRWGEDGTGIALGEEAGWRGG